MRGFYILWLAIFIIPVLSAGAADYNPRAEAITDINRIQPLQNPKYDRMDEILGRRVLDRKNKVVGTVEDIVLNKNGNIASVNAKFDRLQLNRAVPLNYGTLDVQPVTNGYALSKFDDGEIRDYYPSLLADIETASGDDDDTFSLRKLRNLEVWTQDGRRIGNIRDVLFGSNGERAEAVYVGLSVSAMHGKSVAVPFAHVDFAGAMNSGRVTVPDDLADAMISYAKNG